MLSVNIHTNRRFYIHSCMHKKKSTEGRLQAAGVLIFMRPNVENAPNQCESTQRHRHESRFASNKKLETTNLSRFRTWMTGLRENHQFSRRKLPWKFPGQIRKLPAFTQAVPLFAVLQRCYCFFVGLFIYQ